MSWVCINSPILAVVKDFPWRDVGPQNVAQTRVRVIEDVEVGRGVVVTRVAQVSVGRWRCDAEEGLSWAGMRDEGD